MASDDHRHTIRIPLDLYNDVQQDIDAHSNESEYYRDAIRQKVYNDDWLQIYRHTISQFLVFALFLGVINLHNPIIPTTLYIQYSVMIGSTLIALAIIYVGLTDGRRYHDIIPHR